MSQAKPTLTSAEIDFETHCVMDVIFVIIVSVSYQSLSDIRKCISRVYSDISVWSEMSGYCTILLQVLD